MAYYGIDLGTTNSLIGRGNELYSGLVSSSVNISEAKQCDRNCVGEDIISSYKTDMTIGSEGKLPIACSSIILKELAEQAGRRVGERVEDVVISVPAKFSFTQRKAVWKAGEEAGLTVKGLINEPTAAAIYVCQDVKNLIMVYDLGGGTFDITLIDSRAGNYYVVATEGGILAGDDFDEAIVQFIFASMNIKTRYRIASNMQKIKLRVRQAKEALQKTMLTQYISMEGFGVDTDFALTVEDYVALMKNTFEETVTLTKRVMAKNLNAYEKPQLVFVGGSTACPFLRAWVQDEVGLDCVECDCAPDYIVAKGVALYAEMLENGTAAEEIVDVTKRLCIEDDRGMTLTVIDKDTNIPTSGVILIENKTDSDTLTINLYQGDSILTSECEYVGTMSYDYGEVMPAGTGVVELTIIVDRDGIITIKGYNINTGTEQEATIIMNNVE